MRNLFAVILVSLAAPAFAADCIQNEYNENVCVGDRTFPLNQTVVKIDRQKDLVIVREYNKYFTAYNAGSVRVQLKERLGFKVGQVISNPALQLQVIDVQYDAQLNPKFATEFGGEAPAENPTFQHSFTFWRTLYKDVSPYHSALQMKQAKAEAYTTLLRSTGKSVAVHQVDVVEAAFADTNTSLKVSLVPLDVTVVEIHPTLPIVTVSYKLHEKVRRVNMTAAELSLFSSANSKTELLNGCDQINTCADTLHWGSAVRN